MCRTQEGLGQRFAFCLVRCEERSAGVIRVQPVLTSVWTNSKRTLTNSERKMGGTGKSIQRHSHLHGSADEKYIRRAKVSAEEPIRSTG